MRWCLAIASVSAVDGGPSTGTLELAAALQKNGHDVTVVAMQRSGEELAEPASAAVEAGVALRIVETRRKTRSRFSLRFLWSSLWSSRGCDVVSIHGFYQWPAVAGYLARSLWRVPVLSLQPHGVFEAYQESRHRRVKSIFMAVAGRRILKAVSLVATASDVERAGVQQVLGEPGDRIFNLGLGVRRRPPVLPKANDGFRNRSVIFISRIAEKKRLDLLLDAHDFLIARGEKMQLTVCGSDDGSGLLDLFIRERSTSERDFVGHVGGAARERLEASASLFCLPSDNENFGQSITEAMAVGIPVVVTAQCGAAEHVIAADAGWVLDSPSAEELAAALLDALSDPHRLARMSERATRYAREVLTWEATAERWASAAQAAIDRQAVVGPVPVVRRRTLTSRGRAK